VKSNFYSGIALQKVGKDEQAIQHLQRAADPGFDAGWHEAAYFQARALILLDRAEEARILFNHLSEEAERRLKRQRVDFFTKFGQKQSAEYQRAHACYLAGLGCLGMHDEDEAESLFRQVLDLNPNHRWASLEWFVH
jgi:tetratricopeptide (TPR) repeat protein